MVTYVSTQGRFPPILNTDTATGLRIVKQGEPEFANWVTKYELSYRLQGSHHWVVLTDPFKGNEDMTTEVAHMISEGGRSKGGVNCRYLRFRPLAYNGQPAMRVGVYGRRLGKEAEVTRTLPEDEETVI